MRIYNPLTEPPREGPDWATTWARLCSRDGKLLLVDAAIYLGTLVLGYALIVDWLKTGSTLDVWAFILIGLYGHWPLIRNRLRKGDWPG